MKRHILPLLLVLIGTATLCGCSKDELPVTDPVGGNASATPFTITVTDGGYAPADADPNTRVTENGYKTQFTAGDRIGVFAVRNGTIINGVKNLCLTAKNGSSNALEWTDASGKTPIDVPGATYYAYYPYQETLTGELVSTAADAEDFFANVISNWTPKTDQSTYTNYTAQDLMIAQGTVEGGKNLSFSMQHKMALVVIELPNTKYTFNNSSPTVPDYIIDLPGTNFVGFTPYRMSDGTYRYLLKPSATEKLSGSYTNGGTQVWGFSPSAVAAGNYKVFRVDGATVTEKSHTLAAGDFYMKDGSLVGKDETLTPEQQANCIGVVFWIGDPTNADDGDPLLATKGHHDCIHGLVVALHDATTEGIKWSNTTARVNDWTNHVDREGDKVNITEGSKNQGFANTIALTAYNAQQSNTDLKVLPITTIGDYNDKYPAPKGSSGWYVPSILEFVQVCWGQGKEQQGRDGKNLLNDQFKKVGGTLFGDTPYWTSSEYESKPKRAWRVHFDRGRVYFDSKQSSYWVRLICAF